MPEIDDLYCIKVERYGALGMKEEDGHLHVHAITEEDLRGLVNLVLKTIGPGDRAEITLTRGRQHGDSRE